jgi:hypothetical protein
LLKVELILDTRGFSGGLLESSRIDPGEFGFSSAEKFLYRMDLEFYGNLPQWRLANIQLCPIFSLLVSWI